MRLSRIYLSSRRWNVAWLHLTLLDTPTLPAYHRKNSWFNVHGEWRHRASNSVDDVSNKATKSSTNIPAWQTQTSDFCRSVTVDSIHVKRGIIVTYFKRLSQALGQDHLQQHICMLTINQMMTLSMMNIIINDLSIVTLHTYPKQDSGCRKSGRTT